MQIESPSNLRSPIKAILFIPLLIVVGFVPWVVGLVFGSGLGALLDQVSGLQMDWVDLFKIHLWNGSAWGMGLASLGKALPDFFAKTALLLIGLWLLTKFYRRPVRTWLTSAPRFRFDHYFIGLFATFIVVSLVLAAWGYASMGEHYTPNLWRGAAWQVALAVPALLFITCVNAFGEEVLFRGWAMQQLAAFIKHPAVVIGLTAIGFALLHQQFLPLRLTQLLVMGLALGWMAWRLGGLEFAAGAHGAFNIALDIFYPSKMVPLPNPMQWVEKHGITLEQASKIKIELPPSVMDWVALILLGLVLAALAEGLVWWQTARQNRQASRISTPSS